MILEYMFNQLNSMNNNRISKMCIPLQTKGDNTERALEG
jgi:hypothetical protein